MFPSRISRTRSCSVDLWHPVRLSDARYERIRNIAACVPGGEMMFEVQARSVGKLLALKQEHPDQSVALISHADPIRAALAFFLGMPLDFCLRLGVDSACISIVEVDDFGARVQCMNQSGF